MMLFFQLLDNLQVHSNIRLLFPLMWGIKTGIESWWSKSGKPLWDAHPEQGGEPWLSCAKKLGACRIVETSVTQEPATLWLCVAALPEYHKICGRAASTGKVPFLPARIENGNQNHQSPFFLKKFYHPVQSCFFVCIALGISLFLVVFFSLEVLKAQGGFFCFRLRVRVYIITFNWWYIYIYNIDTSGMYHSYI